MYITIFTWIRYIVKFRGLINKNMHENGRFLLTSNGQKCKNVLCPQKVIVNLKIVEIQRNQRNAF